MKVTNFVKDVRAGTISVVEHTRKILDEIKKQNKKYNYFNLIAEESALEQAKELDKGIKKGTAKGKLLGVPISVKDCLCVKGMESRAGSKILSGYKPTFDATPVLRAKEEGAIIIGKTSQDEFGFGSLSVNVGVGFEKPKNPHDENRVCGGSSGGAAGFTALTKFSHIAFGQSTGGSIVAPSSFCGVTGLCPTYGRISRYGLMDYANSLDKIGPIAKSSEEAALLLEVASGFDHRDSTCLPNTVPDYVKSAKNPPKGLKIGVIKEFLKGEVDEKIAEIMWGGIKNLESNGVKYEEISLPLNAKYGIPAYYLIATAEASTNLAKYCGMRYGASANLKGNFDEYFTKVRSENFGEEAKRRIMIGTFARMSGFRDAYYLKAMKVRTKLINEYRSAFKNFDALANPTMPVIAPRFSETEKMSPAQEYAMDLMTCPANLAGLPHISVNAGFHKDMPVGIMFTGDFLGEKKLLSLGNSAEVRFK